MTQYLSPRTLLAALLLQAWLVGAFVAPLHRRSALRPVLQLSAVGPDDTVAIIGASGNVGRLAALRLADLSAVSKVRAVSRNAERAASFLSEIAPEVELVEADVRDRFSLVNALTGVTALIVCTGTTAFPTLAWRGGNTPEQVDNIGVKNVLSAWQEAAGGQAKRLVLMSSIGVERRKNFPFVILNAAGVLDAKAAGEEAARAAVGDWLGSCVIVRPGQLVGGPYDNNYYLGTIAKLDRPARSVLLWDDSPKKAVEVQKGDTLLGDTLRSTVAEVLILSLLSSEPAVGDIAVVNTDGSAPSDSEMRAKVAACLG